MLYCVNQMVVALKYYKNLENVYIFAESSNIDELSPNNYNLRIKQKRYEKDKLYEIAGNLYAICRLSER